MHTDTRYAVRAPGLGLGEAFADETGFKQGDVISPVLFNLYMDCAVRDVMPTIKSLGITFRSTINGALDELDSKILGEEELLWFESYADDIALLSDDTEKLRITALDLAFRRWGLLLSVGKTKTMTVHVPMPGQGPVAAPAIFIDNQRVSNNSATWGKSLPQTA
jgi:hypothetical protein